MFFDMIENEAINQLKEYDRLYYTDGTSPVEDIDYDSLKDYAKKTYPDNPYFLEVGAPVIGDKVKLPFVLGSLNKAVDRDRYRKVQTPQFFHSTLIKKAYQQSFDERFTDDATVLESSGQQIYLFDGDPLNLKITTPEDLMLAELKMKSGS